jgi:hypothetical protein
MHLGPLPQRKPLLAKADSDLYDLHEVEEGIG